MSVADASSLVNKAIAKRDGLSIPTEAQSSRQLRLFMVNRGWVIKKTHGTMLQAGFPDWFAAHPEHAPEGVWIETKSYRDGHMLEPSQVSFCEAFSKCGVRIYVLKGPDSYQKLFGSPNWRLYARGYV